MFRVRVKNAKGWSVLSESSAEIQVRAKTTTMPTFGQAPIYHPDSKEHEDALSETGSKVSIQSSAGSKSLRVARAMTGLSRFRQQKAEAAAFYDMQLVWDIEEEADRSTNVSYTSVPSKLHEGNATKHKHHMQTQARTHARVHTHTCTHGVTGSDGPVQFLRLGFNRKVMMKVRVDNLYCMPEACVHVYYGGYEKADKYPEELDVRRRIWANLMETVTELEDI